MCVCVCVYVRVCIRVYIIKKSIYVCFVTVENKAIQFYKQYLTKMAKTKKSDINTRLLILACITTALLLIPAILHIYHNKPEQKNDK